MTEAYQNCHELEMTTFQTSYIISDILVRQECTYSLFFFFLSINDFQDQTELFLKNEMKQRICSPLMYARGVVAIFMHVLHSIQHARKLILFAYSLHEG